MVTAMSDIFAIATQLDTPHPFGEDPQSYKRVYRDLLRSLHPDTRSESFDPDEAKALFEKLERLWAELDGGVKATNSWNLSTRRHDYVVGPLLSKADVVNEYKVVWGENGKERSGILMFPRSPRDNDLMEAESFVLKQVKTLEDTYQPFFPELEDVFKHRDKASHIERRGVVVNACEEGFVSLAEVHRLVRQVDPKDTAWMFRRLLLALGAIHEVGIIHGAITPSNVLIHPELHGLMIINWRYSVKIDSQIKAIVKKHQSFYPMEVLAKSSVSYGTDIYMAAKIHEYLTGPLTGQDGRAFRSFINSCTLESLSARPNDAWKLLDEYTDLIEYLWGIRKFRIFELPKEK